MVESTPWPAPAKLNLFLHITGRRADGYHELQTVFQLLDWGDEVHIEATDESAIRRLSPIRGVAPEDDLSLRSARLLQDRCGVRHGARISVRKHIPQGAGLGGASSDAATVLVALNSLWSCGLDVDQLAELGTELGADVPVFVRGRSAWAEGIGDKLHPVSLGRRHYVLVFPGFPVSTADVFRDPRLTRDTPPLQRPGAGQTLQCEQWRNDCERVVFEHHPELRRLAESLAHLGTVRMSGTGSTLFIGGLEEMRAKRVTNELKSNYNVRAVEGADRSPLTDRLAQRTSVA